VSFLKILKTEILKLTTQLEMIQILFTPNENESAQFEVLAIFGTQGHSELTRNAPYKIPGTSSVYRNWRSNIRVLGISRKDAYAGPCEELAKTLDLNPVYCIC
jgi:hypothetical protein